MSEVKCVRECGDLRLMRSRCWCVRCNLRQCRVPPVSSWEPGTQHRLHASGERENVRSEGVIVIWGRVSILILWHFQIGWDYDHVLILDHKTNFKWPKSVAQCSTFDLCEYIVMSLVDCIKYLVFSLDFLVPPNESTTNILYTDG